MTTFKKPPCSLSLFLTRGPLPRLALRALGTDPDQGSAAGSPLRLQPRPQEFRRRFANSVGKAIANAGTCLQRESVGFEYHENKNNYDSSSVIFASEWRN